MRNLKFRISFVVLLGCFVLMPPAFGQLNKPESTQEKIARFVRALNSPDKSTRFDAFIMLVEMRNAAAPAVPALTGLLKNKISDTRHLACDLLGLIGDSAAPAVPALIKILNDKQSDIRSNAAFALSLVGSPVAVVAPSLMNAINDTDSKVSDSAAISLAQLMQNVQKQVPQMRGLKLNQNRRFWRSVKTRLYQTKDRDISYPADFEKAELAAFHLVETLEAAK